MKRLAYIKCDNGFKRLLYLSQDKLGGMTEKQNAKLEKELLKNGEYESLKITYLDSLCVSMIDKMIFIQGEK